MALRCTTIYHLRGHAKIGDDEPCTFLGSKALGLECYVIYNVFAWQEGANLVFQGDS